MTYSFSLSCTRGAKIPLASFFIFFLFDFYGTREREYNEVRDSMTCTRFVRSRPCSAKNAREEAHENDSWPFVQLRRETLT